MGITKFVFGFDKSDVKALQESQLGDAAQFQNISDLLGKLKKDQQVDAEQFEKVFGALKEWQEAQNIDAKQFEEVFSALKEWQEAQKIDVEQFEKVFGALEDKIGTEQFQAMQEHLSGLQEKFTGLEEKVETFADMVGGQEQAIIICTIATAVAVTAITSFVAFCIYQGVKLDKEKKNDLSQGTPNGKVDASNVVSQGVLNKLCQTAFLVQHNFQSARKENIKLRDS